MEKNESGIDISDHNFESLKTDAGSGNQDPGWKNPDPG
jgi:hypothetical protein